MGKVDFYQSADEDIALVDEGDGNVGNGFGRVSFYYHFFQSQLIISLQSILQIYR